MTDYALVPAPVGAAPRSLRIVAVAEAVLACGLAHVAYRALQQTALGEYERAVGRRGLPGGVFIALGLAGVWFHGLAGEAFGRGFQSWRYVVIVGLGAALVFGVIGASLLGLGVVPGDLPGVIVRALSWLVGTIFVLWLLARCDFAVLKPSVGWVGLLVLLSLLALPLILGLRSNQPYRTTVCGVVGLFLLTGFGEELFFRGYLQPRLNRAFGRPYRFLGMSFGAGLVLAALLFGAIHVLNPVDYFRGRFDFAWGWGLASSCSGLFYGSLRERTGSIWAGAIAHGLAGVLTEIPRVLAAGDG